MKFISTLLLVSSFCQQPTMEDYWRLQFCSSHGRNGEQHSTRAHLQAGLMYQHQDETTSLVLKWALALCQQKN